MADMAKRGAKYLLLKEFISKHQALPQYNDLIFTITA
jgi:hypothetical protein